MVNLKNDKSLLDIKKLAITKHLNFLLGSGVSTPAIPLMSAYQDDDVDTRNKKILESVKQISKSLLDNDCANVVDSVLNDYEKLMLNILNILNLSNSRQIPKAVNIFTTNYDLFIEKAIDVLSLSHRFVFNDGTTGYFKHYLDSANYNKTVAYRGLNDNYSDEIPMINLIKPHGSINWKKENDYILVEKKVINNSVIVPPTGVEGADTFMNNHFHEMLRLFQLELDKPQSILIVLGFSFQDKHIAKMITRALANPELLIIAFGYSDEDKQTILTNLNIKQAPNNLKILIPSDFIVDSGNCDEKELKNFTMKEFNALIKLGDDYFE